MNRIIPIHDERGHQKPVLSGLIVVLGMLVATGMLGVFYLAGTGQISTQTNTASLPAPPDTWHEYYNSYFRIEHPSNSQIQSVSPTQPDNDTQEGNYPRHWFRHELLHESMILKQNNKLITIRVFRLPDQTSRREFYDTIRDSIRTGKPQSPWSGQIGEVSAGGLPALLVEQQLQRDGEEPLSKISLYLVANNQYFYSLSTTLMPTTQYENQLETFKQIFASLEPRSTNE